MTPGLESSLEPLEFGVLKGALLDHPLFATPAGDPEEDAGEDEDEEGDEDDAEEEVEVEDEDEDEDEE